MFVVEKNQPPPNQRESLRHDTAVSQEIYSPILFIDKIHRYFLSIRFTDTFYR